MTSTDPLEGLRSAVGPEPFGEPFYTRCYDRNGRMFVKRNQWYRYRSGAEHLKHRTVPLSSVKNPELLPIGTDNRLENRCPRHGDQIQVRSKAGWLYLTCRSCDEIVDDDRTWLEIEYCHGQSLEQHWWPNDYPPFEHPICTRCGSPHRIEYHHWAPRQFFSDADVWGEVPLCKPCHQEWHSTMRQAGLGTPRAA